MPDTPDSYTFEGFSSPNYTQIPDEALDELMPILSGAEWKVLCYILRRTFGFKRGSDAISLKQMVEGITTHDGKQLDHGTGLSKPTVTTAVKGLVERGIILATRNQSAERGDEPTLYELRFRAPVLKNATRGGKVSQHARVKKPNTQETVVQETVEQETEKKYPPSSDISSSIRKKTHERIEGETAEEPEESPSHSVAAGFASAGSLLAHRLKAPASEQGGAPLPSAPRPRRTSTPPKEPETPELAVVRGYVQDLRRRFRDYASENSSVTRAYRLFEQAREDRPELDVGTFVGCLEHAASITAERDGEIRYLFRVVESLIWPDEPRARRNTSGYHAPHRRPVGGPLVRVVDGRPLEEAPRQFIQRDWRPPGSDQTEPRDG